MFCGSVLAATVAGRSGAVEVAVEARPVKRWYKGMLHCHAYRSDGRAFPEHAAQPYYDYGYHFFCLSDHNRFAGNKVCWRDVIESDDKATAYGMKSFNHPKVMMAWTQPYRNDA